jgi:hypothetical protein
MTNDKSSQVFLTSGKNMPAKGAPPPLNFGEQSLLPAISLTN